MRGVVSAMAFTVLIGTVANTAAAGDNPWRGDGYHGSLHRPTPRTSVWERGRDGGRLRLGHDPALDFPPESEVEALGVPTWTGTRRDPRYSTPPPPRRSVMSWETVPGYGYGLDLIPQGQGGYGNGGGYDGYRGYGGYGNYGGYGGYGYGYDGYGFGGSPYGRAPVVALPTLPGGGWGSWSGYGPGVTTGYPGYDSGLWPGLW
ncbi:MAG: hypothetical protein H7840_04375 [Alphaproteobacteria bacterium]